MKNQPNIVGGIFEAKASSRGPLPGKGPWFRLDGIWYTQDEIGKWFRMPGQPEEKRTKKEKKANTTS